MEIATGLGLLAAKARVRHWYAPPKPGYGPWELSADRANAVRQILDAEGAPSGNIFMVAGKADTDPLFPDVPTCLRTDASPSP